MQKKKKLLQQKKQRPQQQAGKNRNNQQQRNNGPNTQRKNRQQNRGGQQGRNQSKGILSKAQPNGTSGNKQSGGGKPRMLANRLKNKQSLKNTAVSTINTLFCIVNSYPKVTKHHAFFNINKETFCN